MSVAECFQTNQGIGQLTGLSTGDTLFGMHYGTVQKRKILLLRKKIAASSPLKTY
jgi:hypothetical protein